LTLPCRHEERIVGQVQNTINLLANLDVLHPDVLLQHAIEPDDYKAGLVFRSAVESIRGTFIASSTTGRQGLVKHILDNMQQHGLIAEYKQRSTSNRFDFEIVVQKNPDYFAALEVKGGEGNSINISERPVWAKEFGIWCHLDGAIINQPAHGAHAVVNRITNELVMRGKLVDMLFFKDVLCGTRARPCPKYPGFEEEMGLQTAPDVFLFPQRVPTVYDPEPPTHSLESLKLPRLILELFRVNPELLLKHFWEVRIKLESLSSGQLRHRTEVWHQGRIVDQSTSRAWSR
jgi:hypothetical protein